MQDRSCNEEAGVPDRHRSRRKRLRGPRTPIPPGAPFAKARGGGTVPGGSRLHRQTFRGTRGLAGGPLPTRSRPEGGRPAPASGSARVGIREQPGLLEPPRLEVPDGVRTRTPPRQTPQTRHNGCRYSVPGNSRIRLDDLGGAFGFYTTANPRPTTNEAIARNIPYFNRDCPAVASPNDS